MKQKIIPIIVICLFILTGFSTISIAKKQISETTKPNQNEVLKEQSTSIKTTSIDPDDVELYVGGVFSHFYLRLHRPMYPRFPYDGIYIFIASKGNENFSCVIDASVYDNNGEDIIYDYGDDYDIFPISHTKVDSDGFGISFPLKKGFGKINIDVHVEINDGECSKDLSKTGFRLGRYVILI
jgi:hypothetical protein